MRTGPALASGISMVETDGLRSSSGEDLLIATT
jgi:hypothetical protein